MNIYEFFAACFGFALGGIVGVLGLIHITEKYEHDKRRKLDD